MYTINPVATYQASAPSKEPSLFESFILVYSACLQLSSMMSSFALSRSQEQEEANSQLNILLKKFTEYTKAAGLGWDADDKDVRDAVDAYPNRSQDFASQSLEDYLLKASSIVKDKRANDPTTKSIYSNKAQGKYSLEQSKGNANISVLNSITSLLENTIAALNSSNSTNVKDLQAITEFYQALVQIISKIQI